MASSTIPNSAGPGSSIELSEVTIAVRDKVIEKFADEPLEKMNESVKMLLNNEDDEQKRLGILAARVFILRQRIVKLSEGDNERVVTSASPKPEADTSKAEPQDADDKNASEWTRLRILEDCEVNGVRFPKTVIIDVKSEDAARLIENGNAELIEEKPAEATADTDVDAGDAASDAAISNDNATDSSADGGAEAGNGTDVPAVETDITEVASAEQSADDTEDAVKEVAGDDDGSADDLSDLAASIAAPADSNTENELSDLAAAMKEPEAQDDADNGDDAETDGENETTMNEAFIEAPSAAEVTAALEALGAGDTMDMTAPSPSDVDTPAATTAENTATDLGESKGDEDASGGWFEAQQSAEAASKSEPDTPVDSFASGENEGETDSDK